MRKPNYSATHERENQRRRELLEEEAERERARERLRKAIVEEKEEIRKRNEFMEKHYSNYDYTTMDPIPPMQPRPQIGTKEDLMVKMMKLMVDGPPPTIRVIAKFGQSNYDITITKVEELEAVQAIINKFINAFQPNSNNF